ncbi:metabolite traffic protein EboE [Rubritalea tangerina]|uniref:Metabolite traffic protein EboE n=2 Tax=Rubritalea tangerina TaxID=430798 RepID=A0ABW4Z6P9_9BACT
MKLSSEVHLSYCTNIHPAETWDETFSALQKHTLKVRDAVFSDSNLHEAEPFAIGLRLSANAAEQLLEEDRLDNFKQWLDQESCYVYTINGFPYGAFHDTRVKEQVYAPDWTTSDRLSYTLNLFNIIAELAPRSIGGSVSTLPGSFKEFQADETLIFKHLYACAQHIALLSDQYEKDLHLGLEPEPLGHFENTQESIDFFNRLHQWAASQQLPTDILTKHLGLNYDTCHFALEFENCSDALTRLSEAKIRISKIHLSNALAIKINSVADLDPLLPFDEPTYLHQLILKDANGAITRFKDLPLALIQLQAHPQDLLSPAECRVHFHIPLYDDPAPPLGSTRTHAEEALTYLAEHPELCPHLEMETYTWGVLPDSLQIPIEKQLSKEYLWTLTHWQQVQR